MSDTSFYSLPFEVSNSGSMSKAGNPIIRNISFCIDTDNNGFKILYVESQALRLAQIVSISGKSKYWNVRYFNGSPFVALSIGSIDALYDKAVEQCKKLGSEIPINFANMLKEQFDLNDGVVEKEIQCPVIISEIEQKMRELDILVARLKDELGIS